MLWFNAAPSRREILVATEKRISRMTKARLNTPKPEIQTLEARRMLSLSVTAVTLAGPATLVGGIGNYETLMNGTVVETDTERVVGPETFYGPDVVQVHTTGSTPATDPVVSSDSYDSLTSAGLLEFASSGSVFTSGVETENSTSYSPTEELLPGKMVAGTRYVETTTSTEVTSGDSAISTIVTQQGTLLTLEPAKHSVTVPAGKFTAYVIDESITSSSTTTIDVTGATPITTTSGPTTLTAKRYYSPNVGLVEFAVGTSDKTVLVSAFPKGVGVLTGKLTGALPTTSLTPGKRIHIRQKLTITDSATGPLKEAVTVSYFLSSLTTVDSGSIPLRGTFTAHLNLTGLHHVSYNFNLNAVPITTPEGSYYIVAHVVDSDGVIYDIPSAVQILAGPG